MGLWELTGSLYSSAQICNSVFPTGLQGKECKFGKRLKPPQMRCLRGKGQPP